MVNLLRRFPAIHWRESQATGVPHDGRLVDGVRLPQEGPGWATGSGARPCPQSAEPALRHHGLRAVTLDVIAAYRLAHPDAPQVLMEISAVVAVARSTSTPPTRTASTSTGTPRLDVGRLVPTQ